MSRALVVICLLAAACGGAEPLEPASPAVRLLFGGDVMVGRGASAVVSAEGAGVFAPVRHLIGAAHIAAANLESPLTTAPAATEGHDLRGLPAHAAVLAAAGFDAIALANNHAADGGPAGIADSLDALAGAGLHAVGAGATSPEAWAPVIVPARGLEVALLAVDLTGGAVAPGHGAVLASWDERLLRDAVGAARAEADLVAVGIHGGAEGLPRPDPVLRRAVERVAGWGADVVWVHGAHVVHATEVIDPDGDGRPTVAGFGLGDLIFDRAGSEGALLEVLAGPGGVRAWRVARTATGDGRVAFAGWEPPPGTAVAIAGEWWASTGEHDAPAGSDPPDAAWLGPDVEVLAAGRGDVTGDGAEELVVSFLRPRRPALADRLVGAPLVDAEGRTAHLGVYDASGRQVWVAGTVIRPVVALAVCDGAIATGYSELDGTAVVATGAWRWEGFGFAAASDLPGSGEPTCADVDGDGRLDPVISRR